MYLCNCGSPRSEISSYGNPMSNISNPTSLMKIGFSNEGLCQISHDDLSIDWFSRVNFHDVPRVTVLTLSSENDTKKNYSPSSFCNFIWKFNLMLRAKVMIIFPRSPIWNVIQGSAKTLTSSDYIFKNIARQTLKFRPEIKRDFVSNGFFLASEMSQKKSYRENSTMTYLEQRNPRIQSFDTKCYETNSQKYRRYRSTP